MWVYQQTGTPAHLPEAAQQLPTGEAALLPQPQKTLPPERSAPEVPSPLQRHNTETRQKTCWLLVCAFLIGSGSAGVLLALRKAAAGLAAILPAKLARPVCCCRCTYCGQPFRNGISYAGCGRDPSVPDGLFRTWAGFDLFVYDVLWAGNRDAVCATAFRHGTEKRNVASAACISACGSCFCRAVHARHRFSAGEQPDPRLFLFAAGPDREIVRPHGFIRQYLLTLTLFVPLCGISAALASIGSRL